MPRFPQHRQNCDPAGAPDGRAMEKVEGPEADETQSSRVKAEPLCHLSSRFADAVLALGDLTELSRSAITLIRNR